ncbi:MAG TPA: DUF3179 domain-containing (seleno)protein, partial [Cyclobacteriaceae bacterium]|nr:DUF3179 domain-containing (seleno)protein [Cyclobacteriaceae bacterium]
SIRQIFELYPHALIMQADELFLPRYDSLFLFEQGLRQSKLTGTDTNSWNEKSWVVGIKIGKESKAYDWNRLKQERIINDAIAGVPLVLILLDDDKSFLAFQRPDENFNFSFADGQLKSGAFNFNLKGESLGAATKSLKPILAYQEFWHSWQTFQPETQKY